MKYTAKELKGNVNVSSESPLKELSILLGALLGIVIVTYLVLGFAAEVIITRLPFKTEKSLEFFFSKLYENIPTSEREKSLQQLLDEIVKSTESEKRDFKVHIVQSEQANALALPGGHILVFSALLDKIESENELSFVLAHELGHYNNKDHLRGLGRMLVLVFMTSVLVGDDSTLARFLGDSLINVEMKFSQRQEKNADKWALNVLNRHYGQVAGALDFMKRLAEEEKRGRFTYFFATHPYPQDRIKALKKFIADRCFAQGEKTPYPKIEKSTKSSAQ